MSEFHFIESEGEPDAKDFKVLSKGMLVHHAQNGHPRRSEKYSIFLKDKNEKILGGVIVTFLWNGMEINSLWVDESIRRQGWGTKLVEKIEVEGAKRGCIISYTNTFPWQAPQFYEKLGYKIYGKLDNFPKGESLIYFSKQLKKG
jgi:ribosomal protein S18 acetylase RimI-like enzyme